MKTRALVMAAVMALTAMATTRVAQKPKKQWQSMSPSTSSPETRRFPPASTYRQDIGPHALNDPHFPARTPRRLLSSTQTLPFLESNRKANQN